MNVEEALQALSEAGLVARDARRNPPLVIFGGLASETAYGVEVFRGPFQVAVLSEETPDIFVGRVAGQGQTAGEEETGDLSHVVAWIVAKRTVQQTHNVGQASR